jgi:hypothetical protein
MDELLAFYAIALAGPIAAGLGFAWKAARDRAARAGAPRADRPAGPVRVIRGTLRCPRPVRSPIEGLSCAISWTVIEGRSRLGWPVRAEVGTAGDLLVESAEGPFAVRAEQLWVRRHHIAMQFPVQVALPEHVAAVLRASRIDSRRPLRYGEAFFVDGDPIEIRGVVRDEPCAFLPGAREPRVLPTLTGAGGRLEILTSLGASAPRV